MKNHKESHPSKKTPQQLLVEIRNLITPQQQEKSYNHLSPQQIEDMLRESHEQTMSIKKSRSSKPAVAEKIKEASDFVKNQNQFSLLQEYTKEKISSEMFAPKRGNISEAESQYFQRQREELLKQRMLEQQEERQRQTKVIQSTKKFSRYESKKLPYAEINQFTMKQGSSSMNYLLSQQPQKTEISINNRVDNSKAENIQQRYQLMKHGQQSPIHPHSKLSATNQDTMGQIVVVDDDDTLNQDYLREQTEQNLRQALQQSPRLLRVLKHILLKQVALMKILNDESSSRNRSSVNRSETSFRYKNHPIHLANKVSEPTPQKIADLTKQYKSRGIVLRDMGVRSALKASKTICTKVISKMNGSSAEFHPRKAQLTENQLTWSEEKDEISDNSKKVQLIIQAIKVRKSSKEEGSFFSKQATQVQVVLLEGVNRSITFEKNYLEGSEMYEQLCNIMAQKIYNLNTVIGCKVNQNLSDFIHNKKANTFDMSNQFLQAHDKYPSREYRLMIIGIFGSLFPLRSEVSKVLLASCRMNAEENNKLFKALCFQKLQQMVITQTKINSQSLKSLTSYLSTLKTSKLSLTISNCMIDDQMLLSSKQNLLECTHISKLNLSLNAFGVLGLSVINELAEKEGCLLSQLNINENSITNLAVLGDLIKKCRTLEVVFAENCGFSFDSDDQLKIFFQNLKSCKLRKLSLLRNQLVNHLKCFQEFWVNDTPKQINIQLGIYAEKTSKNLQGRLL